MEEILRKLHKDASGHKHKGIRDACVSARETLASPSRSAKVSASQLREICLLPLQMALESKNSRLGQTALAGMQKLLCEERFVGGVGEEAELREKQLVSQMLEAVRVTPALHEDLQVEVMKVLLCITYSPNFDINGDSILRIAEVCIETYLSSCHQRSINTAVRATLSQILGDLALQLRHRQEGADGDEATPLQRKDVSPTSQALCEDVVTVLTVFCEKLESVDSENQLLQLLYLECLLSMLSSCPPTMHLSRGFTDLVWKQLCPSLVAIMGNPVNDKTITSHHGHTGAVDRDRLSDRPSLGINQDADSCGGGVSDQGRGSGCSSSAPARIAPVVRTVCYIAAELVRLVSCVESMKPVLQSLYHRILLYPPPQHRTEAIRIMKEILGSPQRLYDLAGPCVAEPETRKRSFSKRKSHLDLLKLVMDGMTEACVKGGIEACYSSVSCACALLGALDELSQGRGLQPEQARLLLRRLDDLRDGTESTRESVEINEADFRWQRHVLSSEQPAWDPASNMAAMGAAERSPDISISITTETGQTTLDLEGEGEGLGLGQGHTTPEECGEDGGLPSLSLCGGREVAKREERAEPDLRNRQGEGGGRAGESFSSNFCSGLQAGGIHSPGFETGDSLSCQSLMNADGLYLVSYYALLLNLKLCCCDYYRRRTLAPALGPKEFVRLIQSSGVLVVLSQVWIEELYHQVLERNLLAEAGYWGSPEEHTHTLPLITMLTDIDGLGSSAIGGQLIRRPCSQLPIRCDKTSSDSATAGERTAGTPVAWINMDVNTYCGQCFPQSLINGPVCVCVCVCVAANCASALAQMAAASCVQEEKDEKEVGETGDAITQVKQRVEQRLEQMSRPQGVRLHTAHVLCMDAILNVGLEMGSHNHDCWPHVFRVTEYISSLEHTHFSDGSPLPSSLTTITQQSQQAAAGVDQGLELSCEPSPEASELGLSQPVIQPLSIQELLRESGRAGGRGLDLRGGSLMTGHGAATAVCTLSTQADRLFEEAATKLNMVGLVFFLQQLRKASQSQLFDSVTETGDYSLAMPGEAKSTLEHRSLLLCRLGEAMLRIARNKNRPLLHMMRAWSVVAPHLVEAACHKERHVSQRAVSFIHDVLLEVLTSWAELPHFHVNEALFRPLEHAMQLELCDEDVQDQVVTSIGELVEMCSPQILSGWRPLFSALRTVHSSKTDTKDYLLGEYAMGKSQAPVFDVFEAFINTDNIQVFANAATDYIMCLMKFVKGLGEVDYKEIGDCVLVSGHSSTDLCLPALDYLRRCSQLLAKIYRMPSKPVFLGARLASLPMRSQERSVSSEDGMDCVLQEFDDDTGLIQVWILLLEQLTAAVSNCPRQHQPPTLELLFSLLREVTSVPGPGFAIFSVIQLLLPVMSLWLQRSHGDHAYWDMAAANFKHAIGLSCELVVEHVNSFIHSDIGYESQINLMLKDLFKLLVSCVSEPAETISRVGCSCIRYVLVTVGPVFTEEMWRLACCALQDAFSATLEPVKNLLACFHSGSDSFSGDACEVKVAAPSHSPSAEAEYWRIKAMAQQVFMLDTQCSPKTPSSKDGFEHAQSCVLIIEMPSDQLSNGHAQKRIPFRTIVVSLLSHQVLLQNLSDILLEEFVKQPEGHERVTPVTSDPGRPTAGFLRYISMTNLAIILDLLLDSYRTARDFDTRPGLKYLLMKVSGVCGAANLYRQSAMSFNLYFQALLSATLSQADGMTAQQVKRILYEEEEHSSDSSHPGSASSEDEDIFEETAQVSPPRGRDKRHQWRAPIPSLSVQPLGGGDWAWLVKRLYKLCMDLCNSYIQMHRDLESTLEEAALLRGGGGGGGGGGGDHIFLLPLFQSETSTPTSVGGLSARGTPSEDGGYRCQVADVSAASPGDTPTPSPGLSCTGSLPRRDSGATASSGGGAPGSVGTGRRKEWWESAGNKLYTIATDKTISKLMLEYKRRKQQQPPPQSHVNLFMKEQGRAGSAAGGGIVGEPQRPPQRPQQLVDQQGPPLRHSVSAGPEVLRQEKRPRSGSTISSHSISLRDSEAQIQAWTNMVLTLLNQTLLLTDTSFLALQPALYPCLSQLSCHVTDARVRQALREWLGRVGRLYDIIL
ncbi:putative brefeldin A-inhibited guanine nucleotide-exchange protein 3-like [Scophthalmus maximus]|uniref:Putative brefeldin A-inhibited guanine nucleotide-exchange protein 3-like n=1 Tax=Scophthalmus maximus TaxID=52904 RepID=A0A2U9CIA9_SCOMX|nr:putative brefeldin A-inhibited guanine nucleotide-exchange protein 3-like [Scophthalmus maximus]